MDLVHQLRREKGWTQQHLAKAARVSRATIQRIESGQGRPDNETVLSLAAALEVDAARIRDGAGLAAQVLRVSTICNERAPTPAGEKISATTAERSKVHSEFMSVATAVAAGSRDPDVLLAYLDASARMKSLPRDTSLDEGLELTRRLQSAMRAFNQAGMAVTRLLMQFV